MELDEERNAEFARLYGESIREALENLDKISQQAQQMHENAVNEIIATKDARKKIEENADVIAKEILEARRKKMEEEIQARVEKDLALKLLNAGRRSAEIAEWLEMPLADIEQLQQAMQSPSFKYLDAIVNIGQTGRGGTIHFIQGDKKVPLYWEFGGGDTLALIFVPDEKTWEAQTGIPVERRKYTLEWIAEQVIHQKAEGRKYRIENDVIVIY